MSDADAMLTPPAKTWPVRFTDPAVTATGERRATVTLHALRTLWINTGTLCNVTCAGCYIESSPANDRLAYLTRAEMAAALAEAVSAHPELAEVGFTGGEPFMNRDLPGMLADALAAGRRALVLTNAMRPMRRFEAELLDLRRRYPGRMALRVSLDHYRQAEHEALRGAGSWRPAVDGLLWLVANGFDVTVAGRTPWGEPAEAMRAGYAALFAGLGIDLPPPVLFPELDPAADVPEITERCWSVLHKDPAELMCASARMVVKRRGAERPAIVACTLLPYDPAFELGATLAESRRVVALNHRHCARFCVLGGASCSG